MLPAAEDQNPRYIPQPGKITPKIVGDAIQIGRRYFRVVPVPGAYIDTPEKLLQRAVEDLSQYTPAQFENACQKIQKASPETAKIKIQFTPQGARVNRIEGGRAVSVSSGRSVAPKTNPIKPFFELHEIPPVVKRNSNYWNKTLTESLKNKGYSKEAVQSVIESIFNEGHLFLLDIMEGKASSEWGEKTISDLLHEPGNEELRAALLKVKDSYVTPKVTLEGKKCYSDILIYILKNIQRSPRTMPLENGAEIRQQFIQGNSTLHKKIAHGKIIASEDIGTRGYGFPSEADKDRHREEIIPNNTNLGSVVHIGADKTPERVVTVRSGKSDTIERLQEHVLEACMQQLTCKDPKGLVCTGPGTYEFQHAITTYLDPSRVKAIGEKINTGIGERQYLDKILLENDKWPQSGIIVNLVDTSGQLIQVTLKKPIICNQLLSSTVRGVVLRERRIATMGQAESDLINLMANSSLLSLYPTQLPMTIIKAKNVFEKRFEAELTGATLLSNKGILDSSEAKVYMRTIADFLQKEMQTGHDKLLARALFVVLFRQHPPKSEVSTSRMLINIVPEANEELHVADMEIMRNIVLDKLNISKGKECKSGTDRTAIGVALACAQEKFQDTFGITFDPTSDVHSQKERLWFKTYFREALKEMGVAIVCETKGYSGIKWGGGVPIIGGIANPSAYKYLYLTQDIAPLKSLGIAKNPNADVEGLTDEDLRKGGTNQYKGTLRDPRAFHGKSDKKFAGQLSEARKRISSDTMLRQKVIKEVNSFLLDNLNLQSDAALKDAPLVGDSLELLIHVRDLHLDEPAVPGGSTKRSEILKAHVEQLENDDRTLENSTELYILHQISSLWELIQRADKISVLKTPPFQISPPISPRSDAEKG